MAKKWYIYHQASLPSPGQYCPSIVFSRQGVHGYTYATFEFHKFGEFWGSARLCTKKARSYFLQIWQNWAMYGRAPRKYGLGTFKFIEFSPEGLMIVWPFVSLSIAFWMSSIGPQTKNLCLKYDDCAVANVHWFVHLPYFFNLSIYIQKILNFYKYDNKHTMSIKWHKI